MPTGCTVLFKGQLYQPTGAEIGKEMYVTYLTHSEHKEDYNRYDGCHNPVVLHKNWSFHLGRFPSMEKLREFMEFAGLKLGELTEEKRMGQAGMFRIWNVDCEVSEHGFKELSQIPKGAKSFTGLSNGSLVTCYLMNTGKVLHIYRPNPNYKAVYNPLSVDEHIAYCRENGYV